MSNIISEYIDPANIHCTIKDAIELYKLYPNKIDKVDELSYTCPVCDSKNIISLLNLSYSYTGFYKRINHCKNCNLDWEIKFYY